MKCARARKNEHNKKKKKFEKAETLSIEAWIEENSNAVNNKREISHSLLIVSFVKDRKLIHPPRPALGAGWGVRES